MLQKSLSHLVNSPLWIQNYLKTILLLWSVPSSGRLCCEKIEFLFLVRTSLLKNNPVVWIQVSRALFFPFCIIYPFCIVTLNNSQGFLLIPVFTKTVTIEVVQNSVSFCVIVASSSFVCLFLQLSGHRPVFPDAFRKDLLDEIMSSNSQFPVRKYFYKFLKRQTERLGFETRAQG